MRISTRIVATAVIQPDFRGNDTTLKDFIWNDALPLPGRRIDLGGTMKNQYNFP